jgi:hypothetical protein
MYTKICPYFCPYWLVIKFHLINLILLKLNLMSKFQKQEFSNFCVFTVRMSAWADSPCPVYRCQSCSQKAQNRRNQSSLKYNIEPRRDKQRNSGDSRNLKSVCNQPRKLNRGYPKFRKNGESAIQQLSKTQVFWLWLELSAASLTKNHAEPRSQQRWRRYRHKPNKKLFPSI